MNISLLASLPISKSIAYVLGLMFPLVKIKSIPLLDNKSYLIGPVNHNKNMITDDQLAAHFKSVRHLLITDDNTKDILIKDNQVNKIQSKRGFSILIETGEKTSAECDAILFSLVEKIQNSSEEIKKEFVCGCFDGRSSWDTTSGYLSIDVDRNSRKHELIKNIIESLNINVNVNAREPDYNKNDQIRIKPDSLKQFMKEIGLYSVCRTELVKKGLGI